MCVVPSGSEQQCVRMQLISRVPPKDDEHASGAMLTGNQASVGKCDAQVHQSSTSLSRLGGMAHLQQCSPGIPGYIRSFLSHDVLPTTLPVLSCARPDALVSSDHAVPLRVAEFTRRWNCRIQPGEARMARCSLAFVEDQVLQGGCQSGQGQYVFIQKPALLEAKLSQSRQGGYGSSLQLARGSA